MPRFRKKPVVIDAFQLPPERKDKEPGRVSDTLSSGGRLATNPEHEGNTPPAASESPLRGFAHKPRVAQKLTILHKNPVRFRTYCAKPGPDDCQPMGARPGGLYFLH